MCRDGLGRGHGQAVDARRGLRVARTPDHTHVDGPAGTSVVPLVDGAHPPRTHDAEHFRLDQHVHVVGDGALRTVDRGSQFGDSRGPLKYEIEDRSAQRIGDGAKLRGRRHLDGVGEGVIGDGGIARHL